MEKVTQAMITGSIPTTTAGQCRVGVTSKAWTVMMIPIHTMIARPASGGTAHANIFMVPVRQISVMKSPFAVEYPALAPMRFHAGCPM